MLTGTTSVIDTERQNGRSAIPSLTGEKPTLSGHHRNGGFDPSLPFGTPFFRDAQMRQGCRRTLRHETKVRLMNTVKCD
jgi:hypothetical protein